MSRARRSIRPCSPARTPSSAARCTRRCSTGCPALLDDVDGCRALWADEDAHLDASIAALADGTVTIEEVPSVDLAVVTIPEGLDADPLAHRFAHIVGRDWTEIVHPMAINNATSMLRILLVHGRRYRLELRYETWVMLTSRRVMPRPDLRPIAGRLTELDTAAWIGDGPGGLTPFLRLDGDAESGLDPATLRSTLVALLAAAPPAWDPFDDALRTVPGRATSFMRWRCTVRSGSTRGRGYGRWRSCHVSSSPYRTTRRTRSSSSGPTRTCARAPGRSSTPTRWRCSSTAAR